MSERHMIRMVYEDCISCAMAFEIYKWLNGTCGISNVNADISIDKGINLLVDMKPDELDAFKDRGYVKFMSEIKDVDIASSKDYVKDIKG